ncbi:MAG: hypothetical protein ABI855_15445 [Bacteroidota bacterium]
MKNIEHNLPVTIQQIISWVRQCTPQEKKIIITELFQESKELTLASEKSLAKDWLTDEENEAWKNL